ncbi:MAG: phosphatase PAP2 family protein [Oscillospiraceae bacterium]|jgi:membrane-associated phospholipid phosphatase|nr:phosphatase PAP2 family protein [Oscillospiraceae bacterium]
MAFLSQLDQSILFWMQDTLRTPFLNGFFLSLTTLGDGGLLWIACSGLMLFFKRWRRIGIAALVAMFLAFVSGEIILKNLVARPRPFIEIDALIPLLPMQQGFSFPSGHTASSFAAAFVYVRGAPARWAKISFPILAVLMGISRLYVGVHYPSDVLAGAILGLFWSLVVWQLFLMIQQRRKEEHLKEE